MPYNPSKEDFLHPEAQQYHYHHQDEIEIEKAFGFADFLDPILPETAEEIKDDKEYIIISSDNIIDDELMEDYEIKYKKPIFDKYEGWQPQE